MVCDYISVFTMPYKSGNQIMRVVVNRKANKCAMNPIKYYFINNKGLPIIQQVTSLNKRAILPPCRRTVEELPYQWRNVVCTESVSDIQDYTPIYETNKSFWV